MKQGLALTGGAGGGGCAHCGGGHLVGAALQDLTACAHSHRADPGGKHIPKGGMLFAHSTSPNIAPKVLCSVLTALAHVLERNIPLNMTGCLVSIHIPLNMTGCLVSIHIPHIWWQAVLLA